MSFKKDYHLGLAACLAGLVSVLFAGAIGYHQIEGWNWLDSIYMTVLTVSTVGYREVHPLSDAGKIFTIVMIAFGVGIVAAAFSVIAKAVFENQLRRFLERRGIQKEVNSMRGHTIVCGYGRMGRTVADELTRHGEKVVVIDNEPRVADEIERDGIHVVLGDATDEDVLANAGIERAKSLVATLEGDADNLFLTLTARGMNPDLNIIARSEDDNNCRKFAKAGASRVVSPVGAGTNRIVRLLTRPDIVDFVELVAEDNVRFEIRRIEVGEESPFAGKTLAEGRVRQNAGGLVLSIKRAAGGTLFDPSPDTRLVPGDVLFVAGAAEKR